MEKIVSALEGLKQKQGGLHSEKKRLLTREKTESRVTGEGKTTSKRKRPGGGVAHVHTGLREKQYRTRGRERKEKSVEKTKETRTAGGGEAENPGAGAGSHNYPATTFKRQFFKGVCGEREGEAPAETGNDHGLSRKGSSFGQGPTTK